MNDTIIRDGNIVDVAGRRIFKGSVEIRHGKVVSVKEFDTPSNDFILPGLVDAHIHIESSMLIPSEFARLAVTHGTVATVSDPHEIANVLGMEGIDFMIANSDTVPFKFFFGAPSCVPATGFESSGAHIGPEQVRELLSRDRIKYLSEMMNFPGVIYHDPDVTAKLEAARDAGKPVDGHAPGLSGEAARKYVESGISTDHECFTIEEALEKIKLGMKIQIREGSAARNFDTLVPLMKEHAGDIMFCSDDKHPDDLLLGHMNDLVKRAVGMGYDPVEVIRVCTYNPVMHYGLDVGLLKPGDPADFIVVDNLRDFNVKETFINGEMVAEHGKSLIITQPGETPNIFRARPVRETDIAVPSKGSKINVIRALDGQLITRKEVISPKIVNGQIVSDQEQDVLKIIVINRYQPSKPAVGFIRGFGFRSGAIASTVAHDSHNIIATGVSDADLVNAVNLLVESKGGIAIADGGFKKALPLPVAGIMSDSDGESVARLYEEINAAAKKLGTPLQSPFMTLSFMALLVIPELKLSDRGLFDGNKFEFTSLYAE